MNASSDGRNIVIFSDGTWNSPEEESFGLPTATNVHKLYRACLDAAECDGRQVTWYQPGLGTLGGTFRRALEGATGTGVSRGIRRGYAAIAASYRGPSDRIFLVGFSRAVFVARSIAGMIDAVGLVKVPSARQIDRAFRNYRRRAGKLSPAEAHTDVRVHAIGVWDTVGALGLAMWGRSYNLRSVFPNDFHELSPASSVDHVFHGLAMDERRTSFFPEPWRDGDGARQPSVEECWFRGVHSDVGGGYGDARLSDISLGWMVDRLKSVGLLVRDNAPATRPDPGGRVHNSVRGPLWANVASWPRSAPSKTLQEGAGRREYLHDSIAERERQLRTKGSDERWRQRLRWGEKLRVSVAADRLWVYSGIILEAGHTYRLTAEGYWQDGNDPPVDGFGQPPAQESPIKKLARRWRRLPSARWMSLVALADEPIEVPAGVGSLLEALVHLIWSDPPWFVRRLHPLRTGAGIELSPKRQCMLWLFANDYFRMYANNSGSMAVTVERVDRPARGLAWPGPLVLEDEVRAGDVLLVRGASIQSRVIAGWTGGPYSHAGIFLPQKDDFRPVLHEADATGVGPTVLPGTFVRFASGDLRSALFLGSNVEQAVLLRHPQLEAVSDAELMAATERLSDDALWTHYSSIGRLARPAGLPRVAQDIWNAFEKVSDRVVADRTRRGVFCSELVGRFFELSNLPLQPGGHVSASLSPNSLRPEQSLLRVVESAVLDANRFNSQVVEMFDISFPPSSRSEFLPPLIRSRVQALQVSEAVDDLQHVIGTMARSVHGHSMARGQGLLEQLESRAAGFLRIGELVRASRCRELVVMVSWAMAAEQEAHEALLAGPAAAGVASKDFERVVAAAVGHVIGLAQLIRLQAMRTQTRISLRWQAEVRRSVRRAEPVERWRANRRRRDNVRAWREIKASTSAGEQTILEHFGTPLDDAAADFVEALLARAEARVP
ncbi:hypothetical protein BH11PSE8_BH11PSE8_22250 [soil metagenome]